MYCIKCGKELPEESNFCLICGTNLSEYKKKILAPSSDNAEESGAAVTEVLNQAQISPAVNISETSSNTNAQKNVQLSPPVSISGSPVKYTRSNVRSPMSYFDETGLLLYIFGIVSLIAQAITYFNPMISIDFFGEHEFDIFTLWKLSSEFTNDGLEALKTLFLIMYLAAGITYILSYVIKKPMYFITVIASSISLLSLAVTYLSVIGEASADSSGFSEFAIDLLSEYVSVTSNFIIYIITTILTIIFSCCIGSHTVPRFNARQYTGLNAN